MLDEIDHIERPDSYFFSVARNLLLRRLKRRNIVPIELVAEIESWADDPRPSPEDITISRADYGRAIQIIASLPERCGRIVRLRKIEGWPQKRIAEHLGMTEKAVEKQVWLGVRAVRDIMDGKVRSPVGRPPANRKRQADDE